MRYNHEKAELEFRREWAVKLFLYRKHGMTDEQIAEIYQFDREVFNSDRRYYEHCDDIRFEDSNPKFAVEPDMTQYDETNWTEVFDKELCETLRREPEEHLRAYYLYCVCGYTQDDISSIFTKTQQTISNWIGKIAEIIKNSK